MVFRQWIERIVEGHQHAGEDREDDNKERQHSEQVGLCGGSISNTVTPLHRVKWFQGL